MTGLGGDALQRARDHAAELAAGLGQMNRPVAALEELGSQVLLQRADLPADRRLGQPQFRGGPGEALQPGRRPDPLAEPGEQRQCRTEVAQHVEAGVEFDAATYQGRSLLGGRRKAMAQRSSPGGDAVCRLS